jgi:hypothetical protein
MTPTFAGRSAGSGPATTTAVATASDAERATDGGARSGGSGVKDEFRTGEPPGTPGSLTLRRDDDTAAPVLLLLAASFLLGFAAVWTLDRHRHRHHGGHAA